MEINVAAGVGRDAGKENIPVRADIVIYRDTARTEAFIVGETKAPNEKSGIEQAESYARNLGADFFFWTDDGQTRKAYTTSKYPRKSNPIGDIPFWLGDQPSSSRLSKSFKLPAFKDENALRAVIRSCHDLIWEKQGHDPAKSFDELTKLLFLKLYDERETPSYYDFIVIAEELPKDTAKRIRQLLENAKKSERYRDVFATKFKEGKEETLEIDDFTIYQCVQKLQGYSLIATTENIAGADIKGTVFEEMVGNTFRGELGQFFTPRQIADFMVQLLDPQLDHKVIDPACGSGGFLILVIKHIKQKIKEQSPNLDENQVNQLIKDFALNNIFGTDINERMTRVAKMNMIMHGDGHSGIFNINGLFTVATDPEAAVRNIKPNTCKRAFSNPPFAGYEKDPEILRTFDLGKRKGNPISVTKEILFIERIIKLLDEGGKAGLVLPQGVFSDKKLKYVRDYIKKYTKILALIALPIWAFRPSGTGVRGSLLFFEKTVKPPEDYSIFVRKVDKIGYDSTGNPDETELPQVLKEYTEDKEEHLILFSELDSCFGYTKTGRIDPLFFVKESREKLATFAGSKFQLKTLEEVATFVRERYNTKKEPDEEFLYVEVNNVNVRTGQIKRQMRKGKDITQGTLVVHEGDIIFSRRWPDRGAITVISKEFDNALVVSEFSVLRIIDEKEINKQYLLNLIRTRQFLDMIDVYSTGEMSHRISEEDLKQVKIPVPPPEVQDRLLEEMERYQKEAVDLKQKAHGLEKQAQDKLIQALNLKKSDGKKKHIERFTFDRINE
jgi:type I restriction enzyme M protein